MKYKLLYLIVKFLDFILRRKKLSGIPVIFYHSISDENSRLVVKIEEFKKQIKFLKEKGYQSILPKDLVENADKKEKAFLICFDDGFEDVYKTALPILTQHGFKAAVFVSTDYIGKQSSYAAQAEDQSFNLMAKEELRKLEDAGWFIANHFAAHKKLVDLSDDEIITDYKKAQSVLRDVVKKDNSNIVAYPHNRYNEQVIKVLKKSGVRLAFNGGEKLYEKNDNILAIPRIEANNNFVKFKLFFCPSFYSLKKLLGR